MGQPAKLFVREATGLVRDLGLIDQYLISQAALNWLPSLPLVALLAPYFFPGAYLPAVAALGSIPAFALAFVYARMSAAIPRSGGDYVWSTRILGPLYGSVQFIFMSAAIVINAIGISVFIFPTIGLAPILFSVGYATSSKSLVAAAVGLSGPSLGFPASLLEIVLATGLALLGLRLYSVIQRFTYIFLYIIAGAFLIALLTTSFSNLPANFDAAMRLAGYNATYSGVLSQASSVSSAPLQFDLKNTLLAAVPWGFLTFIGFNFGAYLAGETKNVRSNMYRALLISVVITTVALIVYFNIFYSDFGAQFINAASYVAANHPSYLPALPTVTLLFSFVNPALGALLAVAILVALFVNVYIYIIALARMVFAASFDRLVPERFSRVSDRFHSPFVSTLLVGAVTGIWMTIYWNYGFAAGYLNTSLVQPIAFIMPLIAVLSFPVVRKDLYSTVMSGFRANGLVFVAAIAGIISFLFYIYAETVPILSGVFLGTNLTVAYAAVGGMLAIGVLLYSYAKVNSRRLGIDFRTIYAEIPPE